MKILNFSQKDINNAVKNSQRIEGYSMSKGKTKASALAIIRKYNVKVSS